MVQLSDIREKSEAKSILSKSTEQRSAKQIPLEASLGYEVLYGGRLSSIQVPLSVSTASKSYRSTGSALLDSFVSDYFAESIALQHLRLVNVESQQPPFKEATPQQSDLSPQQPANSEPKKSVTSETVVETFNEETPETTSLQSDAAEISTTLSDQPPTEAEPETIELATNKLSQPGPSIASQTHRPPTISAPVTDSKLARDSAAAVGLIDVNDTLLFGGDHQNLAATDPFIDDITGPNNDTGVLSYLSQQVSAFTVSELKSGFPINTDPRAINRPDPLRHRTVLDLHSFKLGALDEEFIAPKKAELNTSQATQLAAGATQTPEMNALSQQVNALNQRISELSRKLAQITQAQTSI